MPGNNVREHENEAEGKWMKKENEIARMSGLLYIFTLVVAIGRRRAE
jgi:hypothetical protein